MHLSCATRRSTSMRSPRRSLTSNGTASVPVTADERADHARNRSTHMRSTLAVVVVFVLVAASAASAQTDFTALKALPGDRVFVVQPNGVEVSGVLAETSPGAIRI